MNEDLNDLRKTAENATPELWRDIEGSPGYLISSDGRVWSSLSSRMLKTSAHPSGHLYVNLGRSKKRQVHRLVLEAFVGKPGHGKEALHWNGNPKDNRVENLRWGTRSENLKDAVRHGTHFNTKKTHCPRGHEYSLDNTILEQGGNHRICATCKRARQRKGF